MRGAGGGGGGGSSSAQIQLLRARQTCIHTYTLAYIHLYILRNTHTHSASGARTKCSAAATNRRPFYFLCVCLCMRPALASTQLRLYVRECERAYSCCSGVCGGERESSVWCDAVRMAAWRCAERGRSRRRRIAVRDKNKKNKKYCNLHTRCLCSLHSFTLKYELREKNY